MQCALQCVLRYAMCVVVCVAVCVAVYDAVCVAVCVAVCDAVCVAACCSVLQCDLSFANSRVTRDPTESRVTHTNRLWHAYQPIMAQLQTRHGTQ